MKTVAIIGSHPKTRSEFDFERTDCDVWVFNEAMKEEWCKRADAVFQMHQPEIWRTTANRNDPKHYEWLQRQDNPTIYMQDQYDDVPCSKRYPLTEIKAAYPRAYFTSSVSYAIALAIYLEYEHIEVYGVEMETNTEYGHQRTAVAYWVGIAEGMGIKVTYHSQKFFNSALYGYEGNTRIPLSYYEKRIEAIEPALKDAEETYNKTKLSINNLLGTWIQDYKTDMSLLDPLIVKMGQAGHDYGIVDGAQQVNIHYRDKCNQMLKETGAYLIVRQELEGNMINAQNASQVKIPELNESEKRLREARKALNTMANQDVRTRLANEFGEALEGWVKKAVEVGVINGVQIENRQAIMKHDELERMAGGADVIELMNRVDDSIDPMDADVALLEAELDTIESIS